MSGRAEEAVRGRHRVGADGLRGTGYKRVPLSLETQGLSNNLTTSPEPWALLPPLLVSQHIFLSKGDSLLRAIWCQLFTHLFLLCCNQSTAYTLPLSQSKGAEISLPTTNGNKINNMGRFSLIPVLTDTLDKE